MQPLFALHESILPGLTLRHRGKVRDIYELDEEHLLIVATDRLSAFDVVLPQPILGKGEVLARLSRFWFARTARLIPNHLAPSPLAHWVPDSVERRALGDRAMVVRKLSPLPVEAIVRGYLMGSGWKDYCRTGSIGGVALPQGLRVADRLPAPIYTPSTKAAVGAHDENIDFEQTVALLGRERAAQVRDVSLAIYRDAAEYALGRGILIADTKFEFGVDASGTLHLIDEVLTPDSSRFWPLEGYRPGENPLSFDKQFVRDWLEAQPWDKCSPPPRLPDEVLTRTAEKYAEAERRLIEDGSSGSRSVPVGLGS